MRVGSTLKPGQPGTQKLVTKYGDRLLAVRYRYNEETQQRLTTVELVEDVYPWFPSKRTPDTVAVRIDWQEEALRNRLAELQDARWDAKRKLWIIGIVTARKLKLMDRAVPIAAGHL